LYKKIILLFVFVYLSFFICTAQGDLTDDATGDTNFSLRFRDRIDHIMKFRGALSIVCSTIFEHRDGMPTTSRFHPISYDPIDYTDEGDPDGDHHTTEGRVIGGVNSVPLIELYLDYDFIFPFFQKDNFLMKNNFIKFTFHNQLSIVTYNVGASMTISPAAFFEFQTGVLIGEAWAIPTASGLGINDEGVIRRLDFAGPYFQLWFAPTLQMDLAYLMPKHIARFTHFFMVLTPQIKYQAFLGIPDDQPFMYQECPGEKMNGWNLLGRFMLGWRYFIIEDDAGEGRTFIKMRNKNFIISTAFLLWIEYFNFSHFMDSPMSDGWGSDFCYISYGPVLRFDFPWNYFIQMFFLFGNDKTYTSETRGNLDYRDRVYEDWYVYPRWIGVFLGWRF
jgi:hypothetical protein